VGMSNLVMGMSQNLGMFRFEIPSKYANATYVSTCVERTKGST